MYRTRRMMRWLVGAMVAITLLVGMGFNPQLETAPRAAHAEAALQTGGSPLVFLKDGDLWSWNGSALTQLTTWGYNERPIMAPDGSRIAYNSWAEITINAIAAGKPVLGLTPSNIWVMDPRAGASSAVRVANQPADAHFWEEGVADKVLMRSMPTWSPDSRSLAWVELVLPEFSYQLVTYDLAANVSSVIVPNLPSPFSDGGFIGMPEPKWGSAGIALTIAAVNQNSQDLEDTLYVFRADGSQVLATQVGSSSTEWLYDFDWMITNGQEVIGLLYPSGKQYMLQPANGAQEVMPAAPGLSSAAVSPSARAFPALGISDPSVTGQAAWSLLSADMAQSTVLDFDGRPAAMAVAADGSAIAYIKDAVYIWQNGQTVQVPGTEGIAAPGQLGLVWGPNVWRIEVMGDGPGLGPSTSTSGDGGLGGAGGGFWGGCYLTPRLTVGSTGQVTPGLPNVMRAQPRRGVDSPIVGQIPAGGTFSVVNGPICGPEGRYWWQVNYNGVSGWTAEGQGGVYWVQPTVINPPRCTMQPRLTPGTTAYVTPGLANVMRTQPRRGVDSPIIGRIPGGGIFTVLSGPQCGPEGRYWYQVSYNGVVGYTAEGEYGTYWLAPFGCPASPAPRLAPGMQAVVTPGAPNRLRSGPGTNYSTIGEIPGGGFFTVLSGPQCGPEGWSYWRVQYGSQIGWTAEGDGGTYWLEPYTWTPPPTPTPAPVACTLTPRLHVGVGGRVLPGEPNVLRSQPRRGADSAVLTNIPGGAVFGVEGGPVCDSEGRYWWQVDYQGIKGWTPEGQNGVYWVELYPGDGPSASCMPVTLTVGASGYVVPGPSNILRSEPTRGGTSQIIGQIPGNGWFRVLSGPQCDAEGIQWWLVNYNGVTGWTGESQPPSYWAAPFTCGNPMPSRLLPSGAARVTPGEPNVLRSAPGTGSNSTVTGSIPAGTTVSLIGEPQCGNDGRIWWPVVFQGFSGWTAEGDNWVYWLEPLN